MIDILLPILFVVIFAIMCRCLLHYERPPDQFHVA
jgi:hypothetical protein